MLIRSFTMLALSLYLPACDSLENSTDRIAVECGLDQKSVGSHNYLKLLPASGRTYESSDIQALKFNFQMPSGEIAELGITPRACLPIPAKGGILKAVDSRTGESLTKSFDASSTNRTLLTLNLAPKPEFQAQLTCPDDGIFAEDTLAQPLFVNISGEIAGLDIRLDLFSQDNSLIKTLFRKPMGRSELSLPSSLDIRDVQEGSYLLKIYGHHLSQGIGYGPQLLSSEKLCKFHVLRGTVHVGGLTTEMKQSIYPPRSRLPWTAQSPFEKLYACHEKRSSSDLGRTQTSTQCLAQGVCADSANYKEVIQVSTEEAGIFDYFIFAENKAGKRSEMTCQTVIVSDAAPSLSVTWAHEDLKKPGSILRTPYAILRANIETQHELIQNASVTDNLSCKVDFEMKGKNIFSETGVICTEGRCKGKSLADFVPCDRNLAFTMVDALNQPALMNSRLRLTVRNTDGAGHKTEAQTSLWINQSTWIKEPLPNIKNGSTLNILNYLIDPSSDILATFRDSDQVQLAAFTSGRWIELKANDLPVLGYSLTRARDGSIRIARVLRFGDTVKVDIFGYKDSQLVPLAITPEQNLISSCATFLTGPNNEIFCMGIDNVFQLVENQWTPLQLPFDAIDMEARNLADWRILSDGRIAATASSNIYIQDKGTWNKYPLGFKIRASSADLIEDFKGRLWVYIQPNESTHGLYRLDDSKLTPYPSPLPLTRIFGGTTHPKSSSGLAYFAADFLRFDFSTDTWKIDNYLADKIGDLDSRDAFTNDSHRTFIVLGNKGFFETSNDLLYWPIKSLGFTSESGLQSIERINNLLYFVDTTMNPRSLVRIKPSFISSFESNMTDGTDSLANGHWENSDGHTVLNFNDGHQLTISMQLIKKSRASEPFKVAREVIALNSGRYCILNPTGLWLYDPAAGVHKNFVSDTGTGNNQQCTEDSAGKLWWSTYNENTLHYFDGKASKAIDFGRSTNEQIKTLKAILGKSKMLLGTTERLLILNLDGSIEKVLDKKDVRSSQPLAGFQQFVSLSQNEIMLQTVTASNQKLFFSIDFESGSIEEEQDFSNSVGSFNISRSFERNGKSYILTQNPSAVFMVRHNGKWRKLGTRADFEHVPATKTAYPWWFTVDASDRIWFITNRVPYKLGRVEPDWVP